MATAASMRPAKVLMDQVLSRSILQTFSLNGQAQDQFQITAGKLITALELALAVTYTSTTGTVHPSPYDIANVIARFQVVTGGGSTLMDLSGQDLYDKFVKQDGVAMDNKALVGGTAQTAATARMTIRVPMTLDGMKQPADGLLETMQKDVFVTITYNKLTDDGVLFGDTTGLSDVSASLKISTKEYVCSSSVAAYLIANSVQPIIVGNDKEINQTNDAFKIDQLPKVSYLGITIAPRVTDANGNTAPSSALLDADKAMAVKSTLNNNTYQREAVRVLRGETLVRRRDASTPDGLIDVPMTMNGSLAQYIASTSANELFLEVPAINTGTKPNLRIITTSFRRNTEVNK